MGRELPSGHTAEVLKITSFPTGRLGQAAQDKTTRRTDGRLPPEANRGTSLAPCTHAWASPQLSTSPNAFNSLWPSPWGRSQAPPEDSSEEGCPLSGRAGQGVCMCKCKPPSPSKLSTAV